MKHICLRLPFKGAPPFQQFPCAVRTHIYPMCFVSAVCLSCVCTFDLVRFILNDALLDFSFVFRYDIYETDFFCFVCLPYTEVRTAVPDFVCLREKICLASLRAVWGSNPLLIVPIARQSEQLRRKRHHVCSCLRPCDFHSGCPALPDIGYRFCSERARSLAFRLFGTLLKVPAAVLPFGRSQGDFTPFF